MKKQLKTPKKIVVKGSNKDNPAMLPCVPMYKVDPQVR